MRRFGILIVSAIATVSLLAFQPTSTPDASALKGVWQSTHVTVTNEEGTREFDITQPNLLIFTEGHYARLTVRGENARELLPEDDATDEQLLAAWRRFNANAGTYQVRGNEITTKVTVAKNPNGMAEQRESTGTFEVDGNTLVRTGTNSAGTTTFTVTYSRLE